MLGVVAGLRRAESLFGGPPSCQRSWVNTTGEYILGSVVEDAARAAVAAGTAGGLSVEEYIGQFYARFFGVVNVAGVLIQLFLVSRIIKYLGVRVGVMLLPCLAFGAYNILAFFPVLSAVRWAKTAENATDYSLNNTVRNMLFLPCTREQKYSGKQQVIDFFFVRIGDVLSAVLVFVGTAIVTLGGQWFRYGQYRHRGRLAGAGVSGGSRVHATRRDRKPARAETRRVKPRNGASDTGRGSRLRTPSSFSRQARSSRAPQPLETRGGAR